MKISVKLTAIMVALGLFAIASVGITLIVRSRTSITSLSEQYTVSMANGSAANITNFLDSYFYKVETAARVMEQYRSIPTASRRTALLGILEGLTHANSEISAVWCLWEPNVLEGGDLPYLGTTGTNSVGCFAPFCYLDNGRFEVEPVDDYANPAYQ
ncbi:MAG: hypothetical protein LBI04_02675, partial [Treponema sp.]|nr:hypothetical protein [Treponema sp.]